MKKEVNSALIISLCFLVLLGLFWFFSYQEKLIKNNANEISYLRQELENCSKVLDNTTNALEIEKGTCGIDIRKMASDLEGKNEYLAKIDKEMTFCQNDSECVRGYNGCCSSKALNEKYRDLWEKTQGSCFMACAAIFDGRYAICENGTCTESTLLSCVENADCKSYGGGCYNKKYVDKSGNPLGEPDNKWTCECSDNVCNILSS